MAKVVWRTVRSRRRFLTAGQTVRRYLESALEAEVKPGLVKRFEIVVMNWDTAVQFSARKSITLNLIAVYIFPTAGKDVWGYVTGGTRAHSITARRGKTLAFMWGGPGSYKPKTKPPGKIGGPGTVMGGTMHFPVSVWHPGTEGREFEKTITEEFQPEFRRIMENAWRRAIRAI